MGDKQNFNFRLKMTTQAKKMNFFRIFFLLLHIYTSRCSFFVFNKITYLQPFREIIGGQTKRQFSTKKKILFSVFFSSVAHLHVETKLFCCYRNFISSAVQRNHGGARKSVTSTTTNERQRQTTLTIIIARQDSFRILGLIHIGNIFKKMIKSRKNQRHNTFSFSIFSQKNMKGLPP